MNSKNIINNIYQIYNKYNIPKHLRLHMCRTASITEMILDNWNGLEINKDDLIAGMLIHDMGNVLKINFDDPITIDYFEPEDKPKYEFYRDVQQQIISRYGTNDVEVNILIAKEIGANDSIVFLLNHSIKDNEDVYLSNDLALKIRMYSDQRTELYGILGIEERLLKAKARDLKSKNPTYSVNPKFDLWVECAIDIEKQIFQYCKIKPEDINDKSIQKYIDKYLH